MDMFWLNHEQLLKGVNLGFQRYLSRQVKWDRRLIGIFGAKGVGKTTLLLQRIKLAYGDSHEALYLPLDNIWFQERCMLSETVRQFYEEGGRHLFLDNVHRYGSWVQAIECLHDDYPDMQIVFAAPLLVEGEKTEMPFDGKGDWYTLHTMSFREYLSYEGALDLKPVPLDELLLNHAEVTQQVMDEVNIVPIFRNYLEHGCYPFYWEDPDAFNFRLQDLVRDSIDVCKWGCVVTDSDGAVPNFDGLFSGGDCQTGPATVIRAINAGRVASANIDRYLGFDHKIKLEVELPTVQFKGKHECGRCELGEREAGERIHDWNLVEQGLTEEEARQEASRCLRCDHFGFGAFRGGRNLEW